LTLRNSAGSPWPTAEVRLALEGPGAEIMTVTLTGDPSVPGRYGMTFVPAGAGACQIPGGLPAE